MSVLIAPPPVPRGPTGSPPAARRSTGGHVARAAAPVVALAGLALWNPASNGGPSLCPFHTVTGMWCPGCGLTRAAATLARGQVGEALAWHPMIVPLAVQVAFVWIVFTFGRRHFDGLFTPRVRSAMLMLNALALAAVWMVRVRTGQIAELA